MSIERRNDSLVYVENRNRTFEIGSIIINFIGIMLAKLVYNGKVNLKDPILSGRMNALLNEFKSTFYIINFILKLLVLVL